MTKRLILILIAMCFFTACERAPIADFTLSLINTFPSTLNGEPTKWVRFKVANSGLTTFRHVRMRVIDLDDSDNNLYGGQSGYTSDGFHSNATSYGVGTKETLNPGEEAYLACNVGPNSIKNAKAFITLSPVKSPNGKTITRTITFSIQ